MGINSKKNIKNDNESKIKLKLVFEKCFAGYMGGFFIGFIAFHIFFERIWVSILSGFIMGFLFIKPYEKYLINSRKKKLLIQFKDFLEALSASYSSGKNTQDAFKEAHEDMRQLHTDKAQISKELEIINLGMENGYNIEELLSNFAARSDIEDIECFADIFQTSNRTGSNMKAIVCDAKEIISDKIDIEMEIKTAIVEKKAELYIMLIMPFIIILALNTLGDNTFSPSGYTNIIIRAIVLFVVFIAFLIGKKITDIKA